MYAYLLSKAETDEPWKCCGLENDYVKALTCKTCSGIASAGATSHDKNLSALLRVLRRRKRDVKKRKLADLWRVKRVHEPEGRSRCR